MKGMGTSCDDGSNNSQPPQCEPSITSVQHHLRIKTQTHLAQTLTELWPDAHSLQQSVPHLTGAGTLAVAQLHTLFQ
jgi:hypothetical protein